METFEYKGETYAVNEKEIPAVNIPGIGVRTAAEILIDEKAQEYLVERGCVGSVLRKVSSSEGSESAKKAGKKKKGAAEVDGSETSTTEEPKE